MLISFYSENKTLFAVSNRPRAKNILYQDGNFIIDGIDITPHHKDWIKYIEINIDYTPRCVLFLRKVKQRLRW